MARVSRVISGDPAKVAEQINTLAATERILIVEKTFSSGAYIVVTENTTPNGQTCQVVKGAPAAVAALLNGITVDILCPTFSASQYIRVRR